jgi:hypothetical protein
MTITVTNLTAGPFTPTGLAQTLPFTFKALTAAELEVYQLLGLVETIIDPADYTVTLNTAVDGQINEGGSVILDVAAAVVGLGNLYVRAKPSFTQGQVWTDSGSRLKNLNEALDRAALRHASLNQKFLATPPAVLAAAAAADASAAAASAAAAEAVQATGYLVSLATPTGTANALVSAPDALTPIKDAAANQLLILPITANNTGAVTLTVPGVGGGVARPVRYGLGISLLANSLIAGQFALLKYIAASGVYLLVYPNNLSQDGRFALIFRTGASTTNALVTTTQYGNLGAYNINDLFLCPMAVSNTSGTVTLNIDGIGVKPLTNPTGDPLPVPAWADNGVVLIRYRADIDKFVLVMTNYTVSPSDALAPAKTPSYHVVGTSAIGEGLASRLVVTPLTPLPNNTFANTYLHVRFPADRPAEGGMVIKIVGFNDAEYLQIRDFNAVDQVATGRWLAGDVGVIARDPVSSLFYLVRVDRRVAAVSASTQTDFYAMANSRIYALARFSK